MAGEIDHVRTKSEPAPWTMSCCASSKGPLSELPSPWRGMSVGVVGEVVERWLKFNCVCGRSWKVVEGGWSFDRRRGKFGVQERLKYLATSNCCQDSESMTSCWVPLRWSPLIEKMREPRINMLDTVKCRAARLILRHWSDSWLGALQWSSMVLSLQCTYFNLADVQPFASH